MWIPLAKRRSALERVIFVVTRSKAPHVATAVSSEPYQSVFFSLPHSAHIWRQSYEPQLARILLLLPDIVCQPAPVIAGELMPTEVSLDMWNALVDGQKINSYHSIHIHMERVTWKSKWEYTWQDVNSNTKERQRTNR